jgi:hypothetical protein
MKKLLVTVGLALMISGAGAGTALAAPPSEPPTANAAHACVYHGAPGSIGFPNAPFCPV